MPTHTIYKGVNQDRLDLNPRPQSIKHTDKNRQNSPQYYHRQLHWQRRRHQAKNGSALGKKTTESLRAIRQSSTDFTWVPSGSAQRLFLTVLRGHSPVGSRNPRWHHVYETVAKASACTVSRSPTALHFACRRAGLTFPAPHDRPAPSGATPSTDLGVTLKYCQVWLQIINKKETTDKTDTLLNEIPGELSKPTSLSFCMQQKSLMGLWLFQTTTPMCTR